jgi:hypothetical protein
MDQVQRRTRRELLQPRQFADVSRAMPKSAWPAAS